MVKRNTGQKRWGYKNELGQRQEFFTTAGVDLLRGLVALAVGLFLVHWVMKLFERYEAKMKLEPTLRGFIKNLIRILLYVIVIMTAANTMGIPMTSIITLLGSAGVAISLAMQGAPGRPGKPDRRVYPAAVQTDQGRGICENRR